MPWSEFQAYFLALALGLLIGLQRESKNTRSAGIRTFPLIALLGTACAELGSWQTGLGLVALAAIAIASKMHPKQTGGPGITTEVACLVTFAIGALLAHDAIFPALIIAGATMVLLQAKGTLHKFSDRMGAEDMRAITQLTLIGLVVLPLLPDQSFGPYAAVNPFKIWLMVVLIVGLSLLAYFVSKFMGNKKGIFAAGILGGLISSTATTVSISRRAKNSTVLPSRLIAVIIMLASTIVFARVLFEISLVAASHWTALSLPIIAMMAWMALVSLVMYGFARRESPGEEEEHDPPSDLKAAVIFGLLYAAVRIAIAAANDHFGDSGVYVVAFISGMTDMDAIALSSSQMVANGNLGVDTGWRAILTGGMANLIFKAGIAASLGPRRIIKPVFITFLASIAGGIAIIFLWPV